MQRLLVKLDVARAELDKLHNKLTAKDEENDKLRDKLAAKDEEISVLKKETEIWRKLKSIDPKTMKADDPHVQKIVMEMAENMFGGKHK